MTDESSKGTSTAGDSSGEEGGRTTRQAQDNAAQGSGMGPEAWQSMMKGMCDDGMPFAGCCAPFRPGAKPPAGVRPDEPATPDSQPKE